LKAELTFIRSTRFKPYFDYGDYSNCSSAACRRGLLRRHRQASGGQNYKNEPNLKPAPRDRVIAADSLLGLIFLAAQYSSAHSDEGHS
jgi:hypothetical protein